MKEPVNQNARQDASPEELTPPVPVRDRAAVRGEQSYADTAALATETIIPLVQNVEATASAAKVIRVKAASRPDRHR
jgi:hypothetical protein